MQLYDYDKLALSNFKNNTLIKNFYLISIFISSYCFYYVLPELRFLAIYFINFIFLNTKIIYYLVILCLFDLFF